MWRSLLTEERKWELMMIAIIRYRNISTVFQTKFWIYSKSHSRMNMHFCIAIFRGEKFVRLFQFHFLIGCSFKRFIPLILSQSFQVESVLQCVPSSECPMLCEGCPYTRNPIVFLLYVSEPYNLDDFQRISYPITLLSARFQSFWSLPKLMENYQNTAQLYSQKYLPHSYAAPDLYRSLGKLSIIFLYRSVHEVLGD